MPFRPKRLLLTVAWGAMMIAATATAQTRPTGGEVRAGDARIATTGAGLLITQGSDRAVIDWTSFSVGQGGTVDFRNGDGATLNRVTGTDVSRIDGRISASGSVYVMNGAGVIVGQSGVIDVGGSFVASTLEVSEADFMNGGDLLFSGDSTARVVNFGRIGALGGDVALIGARVENRGTILAEDGTAALAAGYEVLMRDAALADGQFVVRLGGDDTQALNAGRISAAAVELRANQGNVLALAGNTDGLIRAEGIATEGGRIFLTAPGGSVRVAAPVTAPAGEIVLNARDITIDGQIDVAALSTPGGDITVEGDSIYLSAAATLDASGTEGGLIRVGGDLMGGRVPGFGAPMTTAETVTVAEGARIAADGTAGQGGDIVLWADGGMTFRGDISATGTGTAPGGFAEVSGGFLLYDGTADLRSAGGAWGELLLDPFNITISTAASAGMSGFTSGAPNSILNATVLTNALATANVNVLTGSGGTQAGNITVATPLVWDSAGRLTLTAANDIAINRAITAPDGGLRIDAGGDVSATGAVSVGLFELIDGAWYQEAVNLPDFYARDFRLTVADASFERYESVFAGEGNIPVIVDVYGLQGVASHSLLDGFYWIGTVDAAGTENWNGGAGFLPIGTAANPFTGVFEGSEGNIVDLTINRPGTTNVGLFGYALDAFINRIHVIDADITGLDNVGTIVGRYQKTTNSFGLVEDSFATGTVTALGQRAGGLIGFGQDAAVVESWARVDVTGATSVGGLVGAADFLVLDVQSVGIVNSYAVGSVTATGTTGVAGGLIGALRGLGFAYFFRNANSVYATGDVTASVGGGLVGSNEGGTGFGLYWDRDTTGRTNAVGFTNDTFNDAIISNADDLTTEEALDPASYLLLGVNAPGTGWVGRSSIRPMLESTAGYEVFVPEQLQILAFFPSDSGELMRDINMGPILADPAGLWGRAGWLPIGQGEGAYQGRFDGNGHVIDGLRIDRRNEDDVGLFGATFDGGEFRSGPLGPVSADIQNLALTNVSIIGGTDTGGLVGQALNTSFAQVLVTGRVQGLDSATGGLFGAAFGGRVDNAASFANVRGTDAVGGLIGVTGDGFVAANSYAQGSVTGTFDVGGLVGFTETFSLLDQVYATGRVTGTTAVGGLVGNNSGTLTAAFWDRTSTTRTNAFGGGSGAGQDVTSLNTAQMQDTFTFQALATARGWNFQTDWAPSAPGFYPANYTIEPVVFVQAGSVTRTYGASNAGLTVTGPSFGGPGLYTFDDPDDLLSVTSASLLAPFSQSLPVGFYRYGSLGGLTSNDGIAYRVVSGTGLDITPAPLFVTPDAISRVYGDADPALTFDATGFVLGEGTSLLTGALRRAPGEDVGSYAIMQGTLSAGANYAITMTGATSFLITPRTLTLSATDLFKIYGEADPAILFDVTGFAFDDDASLLTGSASRAAGEDVGTYAFTPGTLSAGPNYTFAFDGTPGLTITPRGLTIAADDITTIFGQPFPDLTFTIIDGQLVFDDALTGEPRAEGATGATGTFTIGQGSLTAGSNYAITFIPGILTVSPARTRDGTLERSTDAFIPIDFDTDTIADPFFPPPDSGLSAVGPSFSTGGTDAVVDQMQQATAYCSVIGQSEYVIDCLSERLAVIAAGLPESGDYAEARSALNTAAARLAALVAENEDSDFPANLTRSLRPDAPPTSRPLRPVRTDSLAETLAAASGILAETQTQLLRSASASSEAIHFQRIATAVGSTNTILLRSS